MNLQQLSPSERRLIFVFAALAFALLNFSGVRFLMKKRSQIAQISEEVSGRIRSLQKTASQSALWEQRAQWLKNSQPKLESEAAAGNNLLNTLKESAAKHGLALSKPQLATSRSENGITAVPVQFELKGNWAGFCQFLIDLQAPDRFVVVQQARLRVDSADGTQMYGDFTVAKWFAPR